MIAPDQPTAPPQRWVQLSRRGGRCQHSGLSRSSVYRLLQRSNGEIRSLTTRLEGNARENRLLNANDLTAYLEKLAAAQAQAGGQK